MKNPVLFFFRTGSIIPEPISRILFPRFREDGNHSSGRLTLRDMAEPALSLLNLAANGVCPFQPSLTGNVSSYLAFSPLPRNSAGRFGFCDTIPPRQKSAESPLVTILLCAVRTFLPARSGAIPWRRNIKELNENKN